MQTYKVDQVIVTISKFPDMQGMLQQLSAFGPFTPVTASQLQRLSAVGPSTPAAAHQTAQQGGHTSSSSSSSSSRGVLMSGQRGLLLQFLGQEPGGPGDWGPGTKLVGAYLVVGSRADTVIVTLDDDCQ